MRKTALRVSTTVRVLAATAFLALAGMAGRSRGDEASEAWSQGNAACLRGDFDLAVRRYSDAIRLKPNDVGAWSPDHARTGRVGRPWPNLYNNRGYAYLRKGDVDKAIADYDEAIRLDPKYAKACFFRGSAWENKGDWDKAVADYTRAVRLDSRYAREYCDRGLWAKEPALSGHGLPTMPQPAKSGDPGPTEAARGGNFFVAPNGDDRNPGTIDRPWATLYKAHQWVRPGETINLRAGTYEAMINWTKSGTPTAPITIQAYNGEDATLQSSEQYKWTHVADPAFGDCWKVAIPYRRIRYPGLQHAVFEDAAAAATNPRVQIWAIVKGGHMCGSLYAAAHFARPQAAPGLPPADKDGNLAYDVTWYDPSTKTLWFKSGPSRVTDPSRQLYVTSTSSGQFSTEASYLKLKDLKFKYLYYFHQQNTPAGCDIENCEIKHAGGGICGSAVRCTYTSLFIDKVGDWMTWVKDRYWTGGYTAHCFYFNGTRCFVSNCFFGRSNKGGPIQNYPEGVTENVFESNVLYNSCGRSIFMGSGKNYVTNNISLEKTYGMGPWGSMQGFTFANNYSEAADPFGFVFHETGNGAYAGTFEKFTIAGNVFNNTGGCIDYRGNIVDAKPCKIDGNVYLGNPHWHVGLTQANPPLIGFQDCTSYKSYVGALRALPGCAAWEKKSQASSAAPRFDFASFDAFLDSDPPLAAVLLKARQYVKGVIAPFPGAGPALGTAAAENGG